MAEFKERFVDVGASLEVNAQTPENMQPSMRVRNDPTVLRRIKVV